MTEARKQFLVFSVGRNNKGEAVVFHMEGNVAREPVYREGKDGKKSFLSFAIGVGRNPWEVFDDEEISKEQAQNPNYNESKPFIEVVVFGGRADELNGKLVKGSKVALCGKPEKVSYINKAEQTVETVRIIANAIYPLACKASAGGEPISSVAYTIQVYKKKDETEAQNNIVTLLGGKIKSVDAVKEYNGTPVISFNLETVVPSLKMLALTEGTYQKDADYGSYKNVRCSIWGNRVLNLGKVLVPGATLAVTGVPVKNIYNGNEYVNMTVQAFSVMNWATPAEQAATPEDGDHNAPAADIVDIGVDLLDDINSMLSGDDLPF